jgi:hypothetical protein
VIITIGIAPTWAKAAAVVRLNARPAGQPPVGRGHEAGRLLVARDHQLDLRVAQRLDDVEVLFAR